MPIRMDVALARRLVGAALALAVAAVASCSQGRASGSRLPELTGKDLKTVTAETQRVEDTEAAAPLVRVGPVEASRGMSDIDVYVGAPAQPATAEPVPPATTDPDAAPTPAWSSAPADRDNGELVDALVGQINGRPVFASEFFAPMDARLRAESRTLEPRDWVRSAQQQIRAALFERMRDELLLAEFQASLTPEQRLGVLAFVETLRSNLVSENFGSEELAKRRLLEEEGVTIEDKLKAQRDRELIRAQITRILSNRAYVPWREVMLAYERDPNRFAPPAKAVLRMIRVPETDAERTERVREALERTEPFEEVAARESAFNASLGGLYEVTLDQRDYATAKVFGDEELNAKAQALSEGEITGPFVHRGSNVWLMLVSIDAPPPKTLYDEQLAIHGELRAERLAEEEGRYFRELIERASISNFDEMERRLLQIAVDRYFPALAPSTTR